MTGLYMAQAAELLSGPLGHDCYAVATPRTGEPFRLDLTDVELTLAEDWAPHAQARVEASIPATDRLDLLDPRQNCRLSLHAGYIYPDGQEDIQPLADLGLRTRTVVRPASTVSMTAASSEARAQDYRATWWAGMERGGITECIQFLANYAELPDSARVVSPYRPGDFSIPLRDVEVRLGDNYWSIMSAAMESTGNALRLWCDETRTWRIDRRVQSTTGPVSHHLAVGEGGTIIDSESSLDREDWHNAAVIRWAWTDDSGAAHEVVGRAWVDSGPLSVHEAGYKTYFEERDRPVHAASANGIARTVLAGFTSRGRSLTLRAAAAYWLRPGEVVTVKLPTGDTDRHVVQSVTFYPRSGTMRVVTRQPNPAPITSGE